MSKLFINSICYILLFISVTSQANDFYMAFTADPQLLWACGQGTLCQRMAKDKKSQALLSNQWQTDSINKLAAQYGSAFKGVIVNGDLTAFGHLKELHQYQKYFEQRIHAPVYPGLGNHDYANNINNCASNHCARRMIHYLINTLAQLKPKALNFDLKIQDVGFEKINSYKKYTGSLAYSFDINGVHLIQLNNYPSYSTAFKSFDLWSARIESYHITSAMSWLKKDLAKARAADKTIIVNLHDFDQHMKKEEVDRFKKLLTQYQVSAVFWGHLHQYVGRSHRAYPILGFRCGSSPYNTYLWVHFHDRKIKSVSVIDSEYGNVSVREIFT